VTHPLAALGVASRLQKHSESLQIQEEKKFLRGPPWAFGSHEVCKVCKACRPPTTMHSKSGGAGQRFTRHFHTGCARVWVSLNVWKGRADVDSEYILNI